MGKTSLASDISLVSDTSLVSEKIDGHSNMKLVTFVRHAETHIGAIVSEGGASYVLDLNRADSSLPTDMIGFLSEDKIASRAAQRQVAAPKAQCLFPLESVTLLAPVPRPGKIICVGYNYYDHTAPDGTQAPVPDYPNIFGKFSNVVIGPHQSIVYPRVDIQLDFEAELAVIIGRRAKRVDEAHALDVVAGYTICNDVTARDYQNRTSQWTLGKSFDTFGPMGPALTTKDEIPDPGNLEITLTLNGTVMQHSNTRHLIFSIPYLVAYLSQAMTLEPGDVISTGTPSGIGSMRKPPVFMKPGDVVCVQIEKIGEIANTVVAAA